MINKKNRTTCKSCRLQKCLFVGMSKSSSRYGRRSNWFKIHCLLSEQSNSTLGLATNASAPYPPNYLTNLLRHSEHIVHNNDRADLPSPNQGDLAYQVQTQLASLAMLNQDQSSRSDDGHPERQLPGGSRISHPEITRDTEEAGASSRNIVLPEEHAGSQNNNASRTTRMSLAFASMRYASNVRMTTARTDNEDYGQLTDTEQRDTAVRNDSVSDASSAGESSMDDDRTRDGELRSSSSERLHRSNSPSSPEQGSPRNTTLTFRRGYGHYNMNAVHPPRDLVTPTTVHTAAYDRLQISPNPGRVADEQNEPIDLSVRPDRISKESTNDEDQRACTPLDLTKR